MPLMLVSVFAIAIIGLDILLGGRINGTVRSGASFLWSALGSASAAVDQSGLFASQRSLAGENIALRRTIASLQARETENILLANENAALRELVNAPKRQEGGVTVPVLSRPDVSPYGTLVLGAGSDAGIKKGARVFAEGGIILGVVADVSVRTSLVNLFLSPGHQTPGQVGATTLGTVIGRGMGNGLMYVPRDTEVTVGDPVYYSDLASIIGVVGSIESSPADAEKTVYLRVPFNLFGLRFVTVLPPSL